MPDLAAVPLAVAVFAGAVLGLVVGVVLALVWVEARHDCMPHEADRCRYRAGVPTWDREVVP